MTVVVDLGCADYGHQNSLGALVAAYGPELVFGFDVRDGLDESVTEVDGVPAVIRRRAAWVTDGTIDYLANGTSTAVDASGPSRVPCFDFSAWLASERRLRGRERVVKMDIEGAEYPVLEKMIADGTDRSVTELVIEWHGDPARAEAYIALLRCPVKEWWM